jgi:hypothetical protein
LPDDDFKVGIFFRRGGDPLGQIAARVRADSQKIGNHDQAFESGLGSLPDPGEKVGLPALPKGGAQQR